MPEEITPAPGAEGANEEGADVIVTPTKEESVEARIEKAVSPMNNIKPDPLEEADKVAKVEEDDDEDTTPEAEEEEKEVVPEKKEAASEVVEEKPTVEPIIPPREPSSIDKRIAKLYQETQILQGVEATPIEEVLAQIATGSLAEKQAALHRLLTARKSLRGEPDDGKPVVMSQEDQDALVEAKAEEMLKASQGEIEQRDMDMDLVATVDAHPELNEASKEFDPKIAAAVTKLANIDPETGHVRGMKVSEAYALVTESVASATADLKKAEEKRKQKALSGVVTNGGAFGEGESEMTADEEKELRTKHPKKYNQLVKEGKIK